MRHLVFLFTFIGFFCVTQAQEQKINVSFSVGDTIWFWKCQAQNGHFAYIDVYTQTRAIDTTQWSDTITVDFYDWFFKRGGDFDGNRLSCYYSGEAATIVSARQFKDKDTGLDKWVVFAWIDKSKRKVAWINIEKAIEEGEVSLLPR